MGLHLVEREGHAGGLAVAGQGPAEVPSIGRADGRALGGDLDHQEVPSVDLDQLGSHGDRVPRPVRDEGVEARQVGPAAWMAGTRARDPAVILHADQEPARPVSRPVGKTDHGLDERLIRHGLARLALELDVQRLALSDDLLQALGGHCFPSTAVSALTERE